MELAVAAAGAFMMEPRLAAGLKPTAVTGALAAGSRKLADGIAPPGGAAADGWKPLGEFRLRMDRAPSISSHEREIGPNAPLSSSDSIGEREWPPRQWDEFLLAAPPTAIGAEACSVLGGGGSAAPSSYRFKTWFGPCAVVSLEAGRRTAQ